MTIYKLYELPVTIEAGDMKVRMVSAGPMTMTFYQVPKDTDFKTPSRGLPDDMCPCPHWGFCLKGKLRIETREGFEIVEAGQAFYAAPGHIPEFLEDCEFIEFSPAEEYQRVVNHMMKPQ